MIKNTDKAKHFNRLRQEAENFLSGFPQKTQEYSSENIHKLLEDLHVYQIELEMQNEELRRAQTELEESRTRYFELYDFAPIGYFSISRMGEIVELNIAAAHLLGVERRYLIKRKISAFIPSDFQAVFHEHCKQVYESGEKRICELRFKKKDGSIIYVQLQSIVRPDKEESANRIQMAAIDITGRNQAETQLDEYRTHLENLVRERTLTLEKSNNDLKQQITQREQAEGSLRENEITLKKTLTELAQLKNRLHEENIYLKDEIKQAYNFEEIIGQSSSLNKIMTNLKRVASTGTTVLILGETGTGKELIARAIHHISPRNMRAMVKVNCAAIPAALIESELFGHEKGAFTGAHVRRTGRFELADNSSIFLDEVGELPLELQSKLLRVIQEGEFERVGSSHTIKVNVRIIAATNQNLEESVEKGCFRQDLYYRLNVFPLRVPALRERKEDIPLLVNHMVNKYSRKFGKKIISIPIKVLASLQDYSWPGNVRELEHVIERAIILTDGQTLELEDAFGRLAVNMGKGNGPLTLKETERALIVKTLEDSHWVIEGKRGAAIRLKVVPSTLRYKMKIHGINRPPNFEA